MIFQITHTHTSESCPAVHEEKRQALIQGWQSLNASPHIKVLGAYSSPLDHVFHITVEADELSTVVRALAPLNQLGAAQTSPVLPLADLLNLMDEKAT